MGAVESVAAANPLLIHRSGLKALPHLGQLGTLTIKPDLDFSLMLEQDSITRCVNTEGTTSFPVMYKEAQRFRFVRCNLGSYHCLAELDVDQDSGRIKRVQVFTINAQAVQDAAQTMPMYARVPGSPSPIRIIPFDSVEQHWLGAYFNAMMDDDWAVWVMSKLYIDKWTADELLAKLQHGSLTPASYVDAWRDPLLTR